MTGLVTTAIRESATPRPIHPSHSLSRLTIGLGAAGVLILTLAAALSRAPLVFDEAPYLKPLALLDQHGLSLRFLRDYPQPAGLLHNVLHWSLRPWTGLEPPRVRLVNPALLMVTLAATFLSLRLLGSKQPLASSLALVAIPSTWVLTGMVLTEMPSIVLMALSVYLLLRSVRIAPERPGLASAAAVAGGLCLGLGFLSRASVLVVLGALPLLARADWRRAALYGVGTLLVIGPVIAYWGGLVPAHSVVPMAGSSISVRNLLLSFCYGAVMMLIVAPRWFALPARWWLPIVGGVVIVNLVTGSVRIEVMRSVIARLPLELGMLVPRAAGSAMLALAALYVVCSVRHAYARRHDPVWLFTCVAMLLLVAAPGKITHQFSSRYTGMAGGMMVLSGDAVAEPSPWAVLGRAAGMLLGLSSLLSFYALAGT